MKLISLLRTSYDLTCIRTAKFVEWLHEHWVNDLADLAGTTPQPRGDHWVLSITIKLTVLTLNVNICYSANLKESLLFCWLFCFLKGRYTFGNYLKQILT